MCRSQRFLTTVHNSTINCLDKRREHTQAVASIGAKTHLQTPERQKNRDQGAANAANRDGKPMPPENIVRTPRVLELGFQIQRIPTCPTVGATVRTTMLNHRPTKAQNCRICLCDFIWTSLCSETVVRSSMSSSKWQRPEMGSTHRSTPSPTHLGASQPDIMTRA